MKLNVLWTNILDILFTYSTNKKLKFKGSQYLGKYYVLCLLSVAISIALYITFHEDSLLKSDRIESAVTVKVYGVVETNFSRKQFKDHVKEEYALYNRVWDPTDYVEIKQSEVFIMTNVIIQPRQKYSTCAEDPQIPNAICEPNEKNNCSLLGGFKGKGGNGIPTGNCIQTEFNNTKVHTCEIVAWCPIMHRGELPLKKDNSILRATEESVVIISNSINFPEYEFQGRSKKNFRDCDWKDPSCPVHPLGYIIKEAHVDKSYDDVFRYGAVMKMEIRWECYLNNFLDMFRGERPYNPCKPTYKFKDFPNPDYNTWERRNFIYKEHFNENNERTLMKAYGIRIIVMVSGIAKMYELKEWCKQFIALSGIFSLTIWIFSLVVLSFCRKPVSYKEHYDELVDETSPKIICWRFYYCREWVKEINSACKEWVEVKFSSKDVKKCCLLFKKSYIGLIFCSLFVSSLLVLALMSFLIIINMILELK